KKNKKKGKTISLTDFLAEDGGTGGGSTYVRHQSAGLMKQTIWTGMFQPLGIVMMMYRAPPMDRSIPPTAPQAAQEPNIDQSRLPKPPPYTAFLGNLPYDVTEDSIKEFFRGLNISAVHLLREPSNPERLKGFESPGNRRIQVDVADQAQDKDRDDRSFGRDRNYSFDDYPPRRGDDSFGDKYGDRYDSDRYRDGYPDSYCDGPHRDMDRYRGRDRYDDPGGRDYDRGYDSKIGSGRRVFGSGYHRYDRQDDRSWSSRDDYSQDDYRRDDRGSPQRPKLNLKPRTTAKEDDSSPVDTAAREREVEERLQKEQEKLQRQLDEHPSWRSEETPERERSRTGSESSQTGTSATSGRKKSLENETRNKEEDCQSPASKPPKPEQPLEVMPAPPPKENAWRKRSSNPPARSQSSDTEQQSPPSGGGKVVPAQPPEEGWARKDENKVDGVSAPKGQSGNSSRGPGDGGNKDHWKESDRKDGKKDHDSSSAPEPKKAEENPAWKFSSASKYAALAIDGEDENEGGYTE
ncbi:hypothetical protein FD755_019600, partial [Muntiacus reevesi]